jgi:hypothetical protein
MATLPDSVKPVVFGWGEEVAADTACRMFGWGEEVAADRLTFAADRLVPSGPSVPMLWVQLERLGFHDHRDSPPCWHNPQHRAEETHLRYHGTNNVIQLVREGFVVRPALRFLKNMQGFYHYPADRWASAFQYSEPQYLLSEAEDGYLGPLVRVVCEVSTQCFNSCHGKRDWGYTKQVCDRDAVTKLVIVLDEHCKDLFNLFKPSLSSSMQPAAKGQRQSVEIQVSMYCTM